MRFTTSTLLIHKVYIAFFSFECAYVKSAVFFQNTCCYPNVKFKKMKDLFVWNQICNVISHCFVHRAFPPVNAICVLIGIWNTCIIELIAKIIWKKWYESFMKGCWMLFVMKSEEKPKNVHAWDKNFFW